MPGYTAEQLDRFAAARCEKGHRFTDVNYPTPEGFCPFCELPALVDEVERYYGLVASLRIEPQHPPQGLLEQTASPALTASSER